MVASLVQVKIDQIDITESRETYADTDETAEVASFEVEKNRTTSARMKRVLKGGVRHLPWTGQGS